MKQQTVLRGSVWLIASALAAKVLGAVFRIPLTAMLGGEGMGYFSCAYGLFLPVFALSVTGINTAVAALTAQYYGREQPGTAHRTVQLAKRMFAFWGIIGSVFLYLSADALCGHLLQNPPAAAAVKLFSPAVFFCCVNAVLRGEAEGQCRMQPTSVSQVIEGLTRVVFGLLLAGLTVRGILPSFGQSVSASAAAAAIFGVTFSTAAGTLTLLCFRPRHEKSVQPPHLSDRKIRSALMQILLPVAAASLVTNLTTLIDMGTGIRLLTRQLGSQSQANFLFGAYSGLAVTVCNLVPAVTNMLGKGAMPAFAAAYACGDEEKTGQSARQVMERTAFLAIPAGLGLAVLAEPVLRLLFSSRPKETAAAAVPLAVLGISVMFTALCYPVFSMMQAAGFAGDAVTVMLGGAGIKLLLNFLLIPRMGLAGAAWATVFCYGVILLLAAAVFHRRTGIALHIAMILIKPLLAGICCAAAAYAVWHRLDGRFTLMISLFAAVSAGGVIYLIVRRMLSPKRPAAAQSAGVAG